MSFSLRSFSRCTQRGFTTLSLPFLLPRNRMVGRDDVAKYLFGYPEHRQIPTIVTAYHWPDLDGIACAEAMKRLLERVGYNKVHSMISQDPQFEAQLVMERLEIKIPQFQASSHDQIICVDVSDVIDLPITLPREQVKVVIDHRSNFNVENMPNALAWIRPVGAAATMVAGLYRKNELTPEPHIAKLLYAAIMSNTICCKTRNTTLHDVRMAEWTRLAGNVESFFVTEIFQEKSRLDRRDLLSHLDADLPSKNVAIMGKQVAVAQLEIVEVEKLLSGRKDELLQALESLRNARKADAIIFVAIDIRTHQTFFTISDKDIETLIVNEFTLRSLNPYFLYCGQVITRKDVISLFAVQSYL